MRDFGRADAERVGAKRAMGRGVAVAADDQEARQRQSLLRTDDVHDALPGIADPEQPDAVLGAVLLDLPHHAGDLGIGNIRAGAARRHIVVGDAEGQAGLGHRRAAIGELAERVHGAFVHIMAIDPEQRLAVLAPQDLMGGPELVDQGLGLVHARCRALSRLRCRNDA